MSTLEAEKDIKNEVQAKEAIRIMDFGRASERTQGFLFSILFEIGIPPYTGLLL
jgi:hypothetical protein